MDKYEYRVKTEQMKECVAKKEYKKAMEIADTIDWRRVKSSETLCSVSEIYELNGQFGKARNILFVAYDHAPESRKIIYRLGVLALRLGDTSEAMDCYEEFLIIAPKDPNQYILRYKILKAEGASFAQQIEALERFKKIEYVEKWAYELASLYHTAGMATECLAECDDLILWFSEGKHVFEAMELKLKYKPLTQAQQSKYEAYAEKKGIALKSSAVPVGEAVKPAVVKSIPAPEVPEKVEEPVAESVIEPVVSPVDAPVVEAVATSEEATEDYGATTVINEEQLQAIREASDVVPEQVTNVNETVRLDVNAIEEELVAMSTIVPKVGRTRIDKEDSGVTGQLRLEEILMGWEEKQKEMEVAIAQEKVKAEAEADADAIIKAQEDAIKKQEEEKVAQEHPELVLSDDIRQLMEDIENGVESKFVINEQERERRELEPVENKGSMIDELVTTIDVEDEFDDDELDDEFDALEDDEFDASEDDEFEGDELDDEFDALEDDEFDEDEFDLELEADDIEDEFVEEEKEIEEEIPVEEEEEIEEEIPVEEEEEIAEEIPVEEEEEIEEEIPAEEEEEEIAEEIPVEEVEDVQEDEFHEDLDGIFEEEDEFHDSEAFYEEDDMEDEFDVYDPALDDEMSFEDEDDEEEYKVLSEERVAPSRIEMAKAVATGKTAKLPTAEIARAVAAGNKIGQDTGFIVQARYDLDTQSEIGLRAGLTEDQKKLFSYFVPVRGMSEQLVDVLERDKHCNTRSGTSSTGNLLVIGHKGSGKTVLAVDVVKAIQKNRNINQGKVAIITGEALNKKKISEIVGKLYGGALIIEKANGMNEKTVIRLNKAMERETGEILVVLEDERKPLDTLLASNMDFRRKFTSRLEVPVFVNDELVTFGQAYAKENEYRIDEMGILALYSRIDALQREDHPVTVAEVKDIIDEAIDRSKKVGVKLLAKKIFGKNDDGDGRIVLTEKNFNI